VPHIPSLAQAYELRNAVAAEALALLAGEPPADQALRYRRAGAVAGLVKAWESASERIRIARGQPLPGSLRPMGKPTKRPSYGLVHPMPAQPPAPADELEQGEPTAPSGPAPSEDLAG
jgi:hypothetical protein